MQRSALFLTIALMGVTSIVRAQVTDTTPPQLDAAGSGFAPNAIDVTGGPATVTVILSVTDDLSGVTFASPTSPQPGLVLRSPSGVQERRTVFFNQVGGNDLSGQWQADIEFPPGVESGSWQVVQVLLEDKVGNRVELDKAALDNVGFPTTLDVTSNSDLSPPELVSFDIDPLVIDTSVEPQSAVLLTMELSDPDSGVDFSSPATNINYFPVLVLSPDSRFGRVCDVPVLQNGTPQSGTWTSTCYFPRYSQQGNWPINLTLHDAAGNRADIPSADLDFRGFPSNIALTSTPSDTTKPLLASFDFLPKFIDTSAGPATITGTVSASDDLSGFQAAQFNLRSPSGGQTRYLFVYLLKGGSILDGTFEGTVEFPQFSEAGTWNITNAFFYDSVFNYDQLDKAGLEARGFPTTLNVVLPSLDTDGQIGPDGGTVEDVVFGSRATVTLPAGAVAGPTDVKIDVLESELQFDMPEGFAAPGSRFVNIKFDPVPPMPFPAPGATVVLPLVNPLPVGSPLALFRVDPATGELVQAISVGGGPVVGTVDAPDGLSATFLGVSRLSVVVGLIPDDVAPTVTAPASITVAATEAAGARAAASAALATFIAGGSATDNFDPAPLRLTPQLAGVDVTDNTLFALGTSTVSFRYQDTAQNVGTATADVTVIAGRPKITGAVTARSTPSAGVRSITVTLANKGTGNARDVTIKKLVVKTLSGTGTVTVAAPSLPLAIGNLDVGAASPLQLTLNVPATVTRFSITESGTLKDIGGTSLSFSSSQSLIP